MKLVRKIIPQKLINLFWHLPKSFLALLVYQFPSKKLKVIAVTGTDGKTTTTNMIYRALSDSGKKVSMVSTINAVIGDKSIDTGFHITSPSAFAIQRLIKEAVAAKSEYLVLETTAHALDQYRYLGIKFQVGVVTNITHEHLDYFKTMNRYFSAKAKLVKKSKVAILNYDDPSYRKLSAVAPGQIISFGLSRKATFNPISYPFKLKLPGEYNLLNALAAAATISAVEKNSKALRKSLESFSGLNGRMQEVKNKKGLKIIIDFAHTPNGLKQALLTLKQMKQGRSRIISLIGAEGYRDEGKRAIMGKIAAEHSDFVIITAVDPRGLIDQINRQILAGVRTARRLAKEKIFIEEDRFAAINYAINGLAKEGDVIGIFGKGHETSMNLDGKKELPWSDLEAVQTALYGKP